MITILFYLLGLILWLVSSVLASVSLALPTWVISAISDEVSRLGVLQGVLPMVADSRLSGLASTLGLLDIIAWIVSFFSAWILIWILKLVFGILPFHSKADKLTNPDK